MAAVLAVLDPDLHPPVVTHWMTTPSAELEAYGLCFHPLSG
jgi:hypothetical protein